MTLTRDTRPPIFVLVGQFNPAIFDPIWIAMNLYGKKEGEEFNVTEVAGEVGQKTLVLNFIDGVSIKVGLERTDFFVLDDTADTAKAAEQLLLKMLEILPHTPVSAVGCNLTFIDEEPPDEVIRLFETPEALEGEGELNSRHMGAQLKLEQENGVLNFQRRLTAQKALFTFNYHHDVNAASDCVKFVGGMVQRSIEHCANILNSYYHYESYEAVGYSTGVQEERENNADQENG